MSDKQTGLKEKSRKLAELQAAVGKFLTAFATIESILLTGILSALSTDQGAMEHIEELMDFSERLKLMLRLSEERYPGLKAQSRKINKAAKDLAEQRNKIAHGPAMIAVVNWGDDAPYLAGIRKSKTNRTYPQLANKPGERGPVAPLDGLLITLGEIEQQTQQALILQHEMNRFRLSIHHLRYGTPAPG